MRFLSLSLSLVAASAFRQPLATPSIKHSNNDRANSVASMAVSTILPSLLACTIAVSSPALAMDNSVFNNDYADPFHPYCHRKIVVSADGKTFHFSGTGVGSPEDDKVPLRGCSTEERKEYAVRNVEFDGQILAGYRISVGDGIHEGVWEPKNTATTSLGYEDVDGIRWNDGNKWIVESQSYVTKNEEGKNMVIKKPFRVIAGEFIFLSYIGFSTLAGFKGLYDFIKRRQQQEA